MDVTHVNVSLSFFLSVSVSSCIMYKCISHAGKSGHHRYSGARLFGGVRMKYKR